MSDTETLTPNPADFSINEKPGEYTARVEVRGTISIPIKADSKEDAKSQAEAEIESMFDEGYVEIDNIDDIHLRFVTKDPVMYRVTREGKPMQVSHLEAGDIPREPDAADGF